MGEAHLRLGNRGEAYRLFEDVGYVEGIIACGRSALQAGLFTKGEAIFSAAGEEMPQNLLVLCGKKALENGWLEDGKAALATANLEMLIEGLKLCSETALQKGRRMVADEAFMTATALELGRPTT